MSSAVVFAYHDVGVRCLSVLLAHDIDVRLVVTHEDNPAETIWFDSVARLAERHRLPVIKPLDANVPMVLSRVRAAQPDFLFSFYYRSMLGGALLATPRQAALNMHGSLLPKYRGRVPVNWAIIHGERETGATLHYMAAKPDAGAIVDRERVPILPDDTALDVFRKVTYAAEICLHRTVPRLVDGTAAAETQDLAQGSYFGGRRAEDGVINWSLPAQRIHDLVRALAPPYPGATTMLNGRVLKILRTVRAFDLTAAFPRPTLFVQDDGICASAGDGKVLRIIELEFPRETVDLPALIARLRAQPEPLT
jgi:methionyl-tRNA formyltransferase